MSERQCVILIFKLCISFISMKHVFTNSEKFERDSLIVNVICDTSSIDLGIARTMTSCAASCTIADTCISFFFVKPTNRCKGLSTIIRSTTGCHAQAGSVYFTLRDIMTTTSTPSPTTTTTTTTTIPPTTSLLPVVYGTTCTSDADCTMPFTHCLQGTCQCSAGYSYNLTAGLCATNCSAYGTTFIHFPNMALDVPHISQNVGVSLEDCKKQCSVSVFCRGFNYCGFSCGYLCRLKAETPLTSSSKYFPMLTVDYYFRNCA